MSGMSSANITGGCPPFLTRESFALHPHVIHPRLVYEKAYTGDLYKRFPFIFLIIGKDHTRIK